LYAKPLIIWIVLLRRWNEIEKADTEINIEKFCSIDEWIIPKLELSKITKYHKRIIKQ